jgi:hypothetical protein
MGLTIGTDGTVSASRADVSRAQDGRILVRITDGPMENTSILCQDSSMGVCSVVGGPAGTAGQGTLVHRYQGDFAFVGNFSILQLVDDRLMSATQLVHSDLPGNAPTPIQMPQHGVVSYTGQFHAGAGLSDGTSGLVAGTVSLLVDFNQAVLGGTMNGGFADGPGLSASFNNVTINAANGQFAATDNTLFLFQGQRADGALGGAFYGPGAEEAAGLFNMGNAAGGMSGIFMACQGVEAACIRE